MRSAKEILTRLGQEATNAALYLHPPAGSSSLAPPLRLPAPPNPVPPHFHELARQICSGRLPLLGDTLTLEDGPIRWRRDYRSGLETGPRYFRLIPYLDARRAGDHKNIWELNRHQHLVLLAQTGHLEPILSQLESWWEQNPFHCGINWSSALEAAFRALSWIWIYHLIGHRFPAPFRRRFLHSLYQHGRHLENNLSFYFSPNTHLLGEAVALHALGVLFPDFPRAGRWQRLGGEVAEEQMERQVHPDGSHFEQSTYYHVYAFDMFLFHALLSRPSPAYLDRLQRMGDYLHAILGPARKLSFLGDDDGGRFFHPFGSHDEYGRASLATASLLLQRSGWAYDPADLWPQAAWWLGVTEGSGRGRWSSAWFPDAGIAVMTSGATHILADAGPFGPWGSGHSHSDTLSFTLRHNGRPILIDPGTYTYTGDRQQRDWFRGSAAHSTIRINDLDQATSVNPFRWSGQPAVRLHRWVSDAVEDCLEAECSYSGFTHRRRIRLLKPQSCVEVDDEVTGPPGEHTLECRWHLAESSLQSCVISDSPGELIEAWRSPAFGRKETSAILCVTRRTTLPARFHTRIHTIHP